MVKGNKLLALLALAFAWIVLRVMVNVLKGWLT